MTKLFRVKYVSTDPSFTKWASLPKKIENIEKFLNTVKNGRFIFDTEYRAGLQPEVNKKGVITHEWMDGLSGPYLNQGYDFVLLHMSDAQKEKFGIKIGLNGAAQKDNDLVGEAYVMCDEHERRGVYNKFEQVTGHEVRHILKRGTREHDDTHEIHGTRGDIRKSFTGIDMSRYDPRWHYLKGQVTFLKEYIARLMRMLQPKTVYSVCKESLGKDVSPLDRADDILGCAETASEIIKKVVPDFPIMLGTWTMWNYLEKSPRFKRVFLPMPGTIIISPTGLSRHMVPIFPGHVGFFMEKENIASNTSATGRFEQNYTLTTWRKRWEENGGYPVYYYQLVK